MKIRVKKQDSFRVWKKREDFVEKLLNVEMALGLLGVGFLFFWGEAHGSMSIEKMEGMVGELGKFFTGTGFKVGMGITTVIGMVVAAAKHSLSMAAMVMVIGLVASIWIGKLMAG